MNALSRVGWMDVLSRSGLIDTLRRGDWMVK